jgi:group I intron endonuclease
MIGIYKITSPSGKIYIGQSSNYEKRISYYKNLSCKGQPKLYSSLYKYGYDNHVFEFIDECIFDDLNIKERYWQDYYNVLSENGLNCVLTETDILPIRLSEESRLKISNSNKGKKRSKECCEKMSLSRKGKKRPERTIDVRKNISEAKKGDKNGMYGKTGKDNPASKQVICLDTKKIWNSLSECCIENNLNPKNMSRKLSGSRKNNTNFIYLANAE